MKKVEVTVQTKEGPVVTECIETSVPGLVINREKYAAETPDWGLWTIAHGPSGYAVAKRLPNQEIALLAAEWLGSHGYDWSKADPQTTHEDERISPQIRYLIDAADEVRYAIENLAELIERNPLVEEKDSEFEVLATFPLKDDRPPN
jgi:hypothetical protein